ncbi:MAG: hypothetical protein ACUVWP_00365 [bacterium]
MKISLFLCFLFIFFSVIYAAFPYIDKQFAVPFANPYAITVDDTLNYMWISNFEGDIYKVSLSDSNLGQIVDHFKPLPPVVPIGGMVYDKKNNLLIVTLASSDSASAMYNIHLDTHISELRYDITFGWPNGSAWDEGNIWVSHSDFYDRTLYLLDGDNGNQLRTIGVHSKIPTGVASDTTYLYNLASVDGYIFRYDRLTGQRADGDGFPLPPLFSLNPNDSYAGNIVMYSEKTPGEKRFWQSCAANRRIYLIALPVSSDITPTSLGMIKALLK